MGEGMVVTEPCIVCKKLGVRGRRRSLGASEKMGVEHRRSAIAIEAEVAAEFGVAQLSFGGDPRIKPFLERAKRDLRWGEQLRNLLISSEVGSDKSKSLVSILGLSNFLHLRFWNPRRWSA